MTFDTYSLCAFQCQYCFAFYQKVHKLKGYNDRQVRHVNPAKVKEIFEAGEGRNVELSQNAAQFLPYVRSRKVMQWGALSDPFDGCERKYGITLDLLRYFDAIDYPLSFSTKAAWWTQDPRYRELFARHAHNWHVKISVITADPYKAAMIEQGVPSPQERIEAIRTLAGIGIHTTLRLRPFLIGASDHPGAGWPELVMAAAGAGADSVTTEWFCMEARADAPIKERYAAMSRVLGYDLWDFYQTNSPQQGYKRLNRAIKLPVALQMRDLAHSLGMRFTASDAHLRDLNDYVNCCGVPPEWNSQTSHFGGAVYRAVRDGAVQYAEIRPEIERLFQFEWKKAAQFNTGTNAKAALMYDTTMAEWVRLHWNNPKAGASPAKMYECLTPAGRDGDGNIIYRYTP